MMKIRRLVCLPIWAMAFFGPAGALDAAPLFEDDALFELEIEAPMRQLIRTRAARTSFDAVVRYRDSSGSLQAVPAKLSARGHSRLEVCDFPPLSVEFDPEAVADTPFAGQRKLKMVTQCGNGSAERSWLLQEYGIYRAYNAVTDFSYRVRLLAITYRDTAAGGRERKAPAFFMEATEEAAARLDRVVIRPPQVQTQRFEGTALAQALLFQYLIGNTDFAVKRGPAGEGCCHNARVLAAAGAADGWSVLPYDFDQAGIINTRYALPDERLGIRRVTERLYRGFCWHNESLDAAIAQYNEKRAAITAALVPTGVAGAREKRIRRYVDEFYDTVNDPRELQSRIRDQCREDAAFSIRQTTSSPR